MDDDFIDFMENESYHKFSLTRNEALFLDDSCSIMIDMEGEGKPPLTMRGVSPSAGIAVPYDFIERLGHAIIFTTDPDNEGKEAEVKFSTSDLLAMREVAQSYVKIGEEPVGYNLKRKIAKCLHESTYTQTMTDSVAEKLLQGINTEL